MIAIKSFIDFPENDINDIVTRIYVSNLKLYHQQPHANQSKDIFQDLKNQITALKHRNTRLLCMKLPPSHTIKASVFGTLVSDHLVELSLFSAGNYYTPYIFDLAGRFFQNIRSYYNTSDLFVRIPVYDEITKLLWKSLGAELWPPGHSPTEKLQAFVSDEYCIAYMEREDND